jgi:hypothetical protein
VDAVFTKPPGTPGAERISVYRTDTSFEEGAKVSLSLSLSFFLSFSLSLSRPLSLFLSLSLTHSLFLSLSLSLALWGGKKKDIGAQYPFSFFSFYVFLLGFNGAMVEWAPDLYKKAK